MAEQPIIFKKVIKKGGHGHHGGAWKIAYADFVTAMMAFFLLMWLLGSTDEPTKKGISDYFQNPYSIAVTAAGESAGDRTHIIQAGGADLKSVDNGQVQMGQDTPPPADVSEIPPEELEKIAEEKERKMLEAVQEMIETLLDGNPELKEVRDQIKMEITPEGLKIQIVDSQNRPMFKLASSSIESYAQVILKELAPAINGLPNKISINGHTDALPFPNNKSGYSNWELSSDRANVARRQLLAGGIAEEKFVRVVGLAASIPYNEKNPSDPMNRRISIVVMNKKTENQVLHDGATGSSSVMPSLPPVSDSVKSNIRVGE